MELAVPIALDSQDNVVEPAAGKRGEVYRCPECKRPLTLKGGSAKIRKHFSHYPGANCSMETVLHAAAKQAVFNAVVRWLGGSAKGPIMLSRCPGTPWWTCSKIFKESMKRSKVDEIHLEWALDNGLRPDIVLFKNKKPNFCIEVLVTHAVEESKSARMNIPWVEIEASQLLRDPLLWEPRKFAPALNQILQREPCMFCRSIDEEQVKALFETSIESPEVLRAPWRYFRSFRKAFIDLVVKACSEWQSLYEEKPPFLTLRLEENSFKTIASRYWAPPNTRLRWPNH